MNIKICSECGKELSLTDNVCSNCGNPISNVNNTIFEKKEEETNNQKQNILCSECGKEIDCNSEVCSNCGNPIKKKNNLDTKISLDTEIENNIASYLVYGDITKIIIIVFSIIMALICLIASQEEPFILIIGIIIFVVGLIIAFLSSMMIKWFGYNLKCLYDIKNEISKMKE